MQAGDILAISGRGWLSEQIKRATSSQISHVGLIVADHPLILVQEALRRDATRPIEESIEDAQAAWIYHPLDLTELQRGIVIRASLAFSARSYGGLAIGLQLVDSIFHTTWPTDHARWYLNLFPICSFADAIGFGAIQRNFGKEPQSVTPGDMERYVYAHPSKYGISQIK